MLIALDMYLVPKLQAQIVIYSLLYLEASQCLCAFCALISPINPYPANVEIMVSS